MEKLCQVQLHHLSDKHHKYHKHYLLKLCIFLRNHVLKSLTINFLCKLSANNLLLCVLNTAIKLL